MNKTIKIATTIEQSRKLLKLGLKPETADMRYDIISEKQIDGVAKVGYKKDVTTDCIPAWSLTALLELMPERIQLIKNYDESDNLKYYFAIADVMDTEDYRNPIDAAIEMIEWLIENNYIKTR